MNDVLARAERLADRRERARDIAEVVDEYGVPTGLLERVEQRQGPPMEPSPAALMAQAAFINQVAQDAKLVRADELRGVVARARLRRGGDVVARARNHQGAFARVGLGSGSAQRASARRGGRTIVR
jgi:hypothetical protein